MKRIGHYLRGSAIGCLLLSSSAARANSPEPYWVVLDGKGGGTPCETPLSAAGNERFWFLQADLDPGVEERLSLPLRTTLLHVDDSFVGPPLAFERNEGQLAPEVSFLAREAGCHLFLTPTGAVMTLLPGPGVTFAPARVLRMHLVGANASARVQGEQQLSGKINYFIGNKPALWRTNIPTFTRVRYREVYPGIDLVYYGNERRLEYDFIVQPGADPDLIALTFEGADETEIDRNGDLRLTLGQAQIRWRRPKVFQEIGGAKREIAADFVFRSQPEPKAAGASRTVLFRLAGFDSSRPMVIDPVMVYSTYLGGDQSGCCGPRSSGGGVAADNAGNAYVTGLTYSTDFPTTNAVQGFNAGLSDAFVSKFSPTGELIYSTYLGGSDQDDFEFYGRVAADASGNAYVVGTTLSPDFPVVNAFQPQFGGGADAFVAKLSPDGATLIYSTYLGGPGFDYARAIAVDRLGDAYIAGSASAGFPVYQALYPAFTNGANAGYLAKLDPSGGALVFSTFLQSFGVIGIAVDGAGNACLCGNAGPGFPVTNAIQPTAGTTNYYAAVVAKVKSDGSQLLFSTFYGGSLNNVATSIAIGPEGDLYIAFATDSPDFPTVNPFQPQKKGATGIFNAAVVRMKPDGSSVVYSTYLGGSGNGPYGGESVLGIGVDTNGNAYIGGATGSLDFPLYNPFQNTFSGADSGFISILSHDGSALLFSSYFSPPSSAVFQPVAFKTDSAGSAYLAGSTDAVDFPVTNAFQPTLAGTTDAFVTKFSNLLPLQLRIEHSGTVLTLSWPVSAGDFTLESAAALGQTANWSPVPQAPQVVGDQYALSLDMTNTAQFFRLRK